MSTSPEPATESDEQTIEKRVAQASIALVTTVAEDGSLVSRPLAVQRASSTVTCGSSPRTRRAPRRSARTTRAKAVFAQLDTERATNGLLALETAMDNETPPDDGHRRNIVSTTDTDVGVDVVDDSTHGRVWRTTGFGRLR